MARAWAEYPFADFVAHFAELQPLMRAEPPSCYEEYVVRTFAWMRERCGGESDTARDWAGLYVQIECYLASHMDAFDREDFSVLGSRAVGGLIGEHLLRAVHWFFTTYTLAQLGEMGHRGPSPEAVMAKARELRTTETESAGD